MSSPVLVIAWHELQPSPVCASWVAMNVSTGWSIIPLKSSAWSWQPAHHLADSTEFTSCMYSIDLRYHWLLKDEKW